MTDPTTLTPVQTIQGEKIGEIDFAALIEAGEPVMLKAVAIDFPLVEAGREGVDAAMAYLLRFDAGRPVVGFVGASQIGGGFFYNDDITGMNYAAARAPLTDYLERIRTGMAEDDAPSVYLGSTDLDVYFPRPRR